MSTGRSATSAELLGFLTNHPLFPGVGQDTLRFLARECRFRVFEKNERLFLEAEDPECAYLVRSGRISIVLNAPDGRELVMDEMRAGDILGEIGVLTRTAHSAGALARTRTEVLVIPGEVLVLLIDREPAVTRRLLDIMACRLQKSAAREMALAFMDAQSRLARYLLALEVGDHDKGYITASQEDLARGTGLIRQTVAKALGRWRRDGWLLTGRGRILILNRKALEHLGRGLLN